jgi:hypothetical protein
MNNIDYKKIILAVNFISIICFIVAIFLQNNTINKLKGNEKAMILKDSLKTKTIDSLGEKLTFTKIKLEDCFSENSRMNIENSKNKLWLKSKDDECEHEKDMLYIEYNTNTDDTGKLLSEIGQLNSLSDVERMVLSKKTNRKPD